MQAHIKETEPNNEDVPASKAGYTEFTEQAPGSKATNQLKKEPSKEGYVLPDDDDDTV